MTVLMISAAVELKAVASSISLSFYASVFLMVLMCWVIFISSALCVSTSVRSGMVQNINSLQLELMLGEAGG